MDVPVLTAIIGVSGTLMGTIVGGCLTAFANFLLNKRREKAEFRIACRLIADELNEYEALIYTTLEEKRWWPEELEPETQAWEKHEHVLASYLPYEAWCDVRGGIQSARTCNLLGAHAREEKIETIEDREFSWLNGYGFRIRKGRVSLQPYLRK